MLVMVSPVAGHLNRSVSEQLSVLLLLILQCPGIIIVSGNATEQPQVDPSELLGEYYW